VLRPCAYAEGVACGIEHHDESGISVRLVLGCRGTVLLKENLGIVDIVDEEVQVNLHWNFCRGPRRRPVVVDLGHRSIVIRCGQLARSFGGGGCQRRR
jgi:hypothetical protein